MALIHRQPGENNEEHDFIMRIFITKYQIVLYQPNDGKKKSLRVFFQAWISSQQLTRPEPDIISKRKPSVTILNIFD
jgi:hypothetical protein